jgi:hypothetical protein
VKCYIWITAWYGSGEGEGYRRSVGPIAWKIKYYKKSRRKERSYVYMQQNEGRLKLLVTSCIGTASTAYKQLLNGIQERRRYGKLKDEALDRTLGRTHLWKGYGSVVRKTTWWWWWWINYRGQENETLH